MSVTTDVRELKTALQAQLDVMSEIEKKGIKIDGENVEVSEADAALYRKSLASASELRGHIEMYDQGAELKAWASGSDQPGGVAAQAAAAAASAVREQFSDRELKSLGEMFTESDEFKEFRKTGRDTMDKPWTLETGDLGGFVGGRKDVFTASAPVQSTRGFGRTQFDPMVPRAQRQARVRDLFPVASTDANLIDYFRVIGFGSSRLDLTSGARTVAERRAANGTGTPVGDTTDVFGLKPKSNLTFQSAQAPVRTIAHYEAAHRNVLADEPQLQSTINNELLYGLRLEEDNQILNGDGTGENLLGIMNTPNVQSYTQPAATDPFDAQNDITKADALRKAATLAILAYYPPNGYVLNPYDWEDIELQKNTQGSYIVAMNVAIGAQTQVWRQPVVESPVMPEGKFLTGAWGLGAQLYDREQANIRIAEQHADFFIRNAVVILAEQRLALAVKRPESFVKGTFR